MLNFAFRYLHFFISVALFSFSNQQNKILKLLNPKF